MINDVTTSIYKNYIYLDVIIHKKYEILFLYSIMKTFIG